MQRVVQTTIDTASIKVPIIAEEGVFVTQLMASIRAIHLEPVLVSPEKFHTLTSDPEIMNLFSKGYVCLWIDYPVFCDQKKKQYHYQHVFSTLRYMLCIPLLVVTFDASKRRKNGRAGQNPTRTTDWLIHELPLCFPKAHHIDYQHVIYPYEGGVSTVQRFFIEKIQEQNRREVVGECRLLWFTDAVENLLSLLYDPLLANGIFEGKTPISFADLERKLREVARLPALTGTVMDFPFEFETGKGIGRQNLSEMLQELAIIIPKPAMEAFIDVRIAKPVLVPMATKPKITKKHRALRLAGWILGIFFLAYFLGSAYFLSCFFSVRENLQDFVLLPEGKSFEEKQLRLRKNLSFLRMYADTVPFPYALVGISLSKLRIIEGIREMEKMVLNTESFEQAKRELYSGKKDSKDNRSFDDIYQEMSSLQAKLSSGDLTLDLVFGIDGFSRSLEQRLVSWRQDINEQKAVRSFLPTIRGEERRFTLAVVSFTSRPSRPLFGIPKEVLVLTFEEGKIITSQTYLPSELNTLLKGTTLPPEEMQTYTGINNWKISDGAWSLDGPTAAREISWFLSKELHQDLDGLILLDEKSIPQIVSELQTEEAGGLISQNTNEEHVLGTHTSSLEELTKETPQPSQDGLLLSAIFKLFSSNQGVLFLKDQSLQKTVEALSWDASIATPSCPSSFALDRVCMVTTQYVAEYDIGNSLDGKFSSKKEHHHEIKLSPENTSHQDTITYSPGINGQSKLLKYTIDAGATVDSVTINGTPLSLEQVTITKEYQKTVVSFLVPLSSLEDTVIRVSYTSAAIPTTQSAFAFFVQKQLGIEAENFTLTVRFSKEYTAKVIAPSASFGKQEAVFATNLETNKFFAIGF